MALTKQPLTINFSKGLDLKTDPFQLEPGKFLQLENSVFTKGGLLAKRNGFGNLATLPDTTSNFVTTFNGNLLAIGDSLRAYSSGSETWVTKASYTNVELAVLPLIRSNTNQTQADAVVAANGLICTVYTDAGAYKYAIADSVTGQNIIAPTVITPSSGTVVGSPKVFILGTQFIIMFTNLISGVYHLKYIPISTSTPTVVGSDTNISSVYSPSSTVNFDAVVANNSLYVAWNGSDISVKVTRIDTALIQYSTLSFAGRVSTMTSVTADESGIIPIVYIAFYDSVSQTGYVAAVNATLVQILAPTQVISAEEVGNLTSISNVGSTTIYYEVNNNYAYNSSIPTHFIKTRSITQAGSVGSASVLVRSVGLASEAFIINDITYFLGVYDSDFQPSYFLINQYGKVVSKLAYSNGSGYLTTGIPSVTVADSTVQIPYLIKDQIQAVNKTQGAANAAGVYSQTGINLATFTLSTPVNSTAEIGGNINLSGGFLWGYDGYSITENGFFLWPDSLNATTSSGSSNLGTITTDGLYTIHTYISNGTFQIASGSGNVEILVVAGGGGGGPATNTGQAGGGGGSGGIIHTTAAYGAGSYAVTIGAGGAAGANGSNSIFDSYTAIGGGFGGNTSGGGPAHGNAGGSGGGASSDAGIGATFPGGAGTVGQGNAGGNGTGPAFVGAGGGGAGAVGSDGSGTTGGNGGIGLSFAISGSSVDYAGGGGGGSQNGTAGSASFGGGAGAGTGATTNGAPGIANTGGGGGGAGGTALTGIGGVGGSGIVILRYLTSQITAYGGNMAAQQYFYAATYEWSDNQGNIFRSAPSIPLGVVVTNPNASVVVNIPTLRVTYKTQNPVKIVLYRWSAAQQNYFQTTLIANPLLNNTAIDFITFVDTNSDATILGNNLLYTTGGVLENISAPASDNVALFQSRLFMIDAEDKNLLWFSKQVIESTPVEMSDLLTIFVAPTISAQGNTGYLTALSALDDKLILFKKDAIYYLNGQGPDNTGANSQFSDPVFITSTVGCANQKSIVFMPNGLMFQSDKGIWLLGRDLSTNYIGAAVETLTDGAIVLSALNIPATNQVRFTLSTGITLMYDYYYGQWGSFINIPGTSSTLYNGLHTYINSIGQVRQETPAAYLDGDTPVLMSFTTSWLNLAGLQGYERAYFFYLLGTYISPHILTMAIAYDYNSSPTQSTRIYPDNYTGPWGGKAQWGSSPSWGGNQSLEQWRVFLQTQKCQAFQITLKESFDATLGIPAGAGFTLSGLDVVLGMKSGYPRLRSTRSVG